MTSREKFSVFAAGATCATLLIVGMLLSTPRGKAQDQGDAFDSRIEQGLEIAPVTLNLAGKDRALVGLGSYIVNAQADCNGCHTLNPAVQFTPTGNPYLLSPPFSGKVTTDPLHYLAGGRDFGPFPGGPGSIPHLYTRNLTPDKTGLPEGGHTFAESRATPCHSRFVDLSGPTGIATRTYLAASLLLANRFRY